MAQLLASEFTSFTLDNMGRFLCNTLQEALDSTTQTIAGRRRDFDVHGERSVDRCDGKRSCRSSRSLDRRSGR